MERSFGEGGHGGDEDVQEMDMLAALHIYKIEVATTCILELPPTDLFIRIVNLLKILGHSSSKVGPFTVKVKQWNWKLSGFKLWNVGYISTSDQEGQCPLLDNCVFIYFNKWWPFYQREREREMTMTMTISKWSKQMLFSGLSKMLLHESNKKDYMRIRGWYSPLI